MIALLTIGLGVSLIALLHYVLKDVQRKGRDLRESERQKREDLRRLRALQYGREMQRQKFKVVNGSKS